MVRRIGICLASFLAIGGLIALPGAARAAGAGQLSVTALASSSSTVDATGGTASVTLTWTVKDSSGSATDVAGDVYIRMAGSTPGDFIGMATVAPYDLDGALTGDVSGNPTGTAQDASFSYTFAVPQYANASTARWQVSEVTASDNHGASRTLGWAPLVRFNAVLTASELVDSTPATYDQLVFADFSQRPYFYDNGVSASITYSLEVIDPQSGFWNGTVQLSGPDGQHAHGDFAATYSVAEGLDVCGTGIGFGSQDMFCTVTVTIPANSAAGTWAISAISLTDNAGNSRTYGGLDALPVTVTANKVMRASGFSASPNPVNDWGTFTNTTLTLSVTGAVGGVAAIYVDGTVGDCGQSSAATSPTANPDGTYSVQLYVVENAASCTITGVAVEDGAGDFSLYGSEYGAPDPGVTITRVPDTTPPVATAASLTSASIPYSPDSQFDGLNITVDDAVAPVDQVTEIVYDSSGNVVGGGFGGVTSTLTGVINTSVNIGAGMAPGTYTVGFILTDAAGLETAYGTPNSQPVPGGPLTFTITSS